jgi:predicted adenylyl cyclase CyaB
LRTILRQRGTLSRDGHLVEVALDNIQVIGCFLELEISANDESLESAKKALESLAQELGLGKTERRSYLELIKSRTS